MTDNPVKLLTADEVEDIAAMFSDTDYQPEPRTMLRCMYCDCSDDHKPNCVVPYISALCATVRALREKHERLVEVSGKWARLIDCIRAWSKCDDGYPLDEHINNIATQNTALREQLAQLEETNRLAGLTVVELQSQLAQVTQERDDLLNRSHQTVLFDCGCMFKQEGLDAEPMLIVHCAIHCVTKEQP